MKTQRRDFLKKVILSTGGLWIGFSEKSFGLTTFKNNVGSEGILENNFLHIGNNNEITIWSPNPEIGQGIKTAFAVIVAEELDVDWQKVIVKQANLDTKRFERQLTGGSGAIKHSWERLRKAGASARYLLMMATAQKLNVAISELSTEKGIVKHVGSGKEFSYGELATLAAELKLPNNVPLKDKKDFKLIGSTIKSVDNFDVLTGKAIYGIDFKTPDMVYARLLRPKGFGQKLKSFDATDALKVKGIKDVFSMGDKVAIIADSNFPLIKAASLIKIDWSSPKMLESDDSHNKTFTELMANGPFEVRRKDGDPEKAFKEASKTVEAEYQCPFLPHNPMEPMNFFADVKGDKVRLVGPTQVPAAAQTQVSKLLNVPVENITVELTKMGGGFGRRLNNDYCLEAAELSSKINKPVKLLWTREDDMSGGIYRPAVRYKFKAALDKKGNITGYSLRGVGMNAGNSTRQDNFPVGAVENVIIESADFKSDITTGPWRAPITNFLAYAEQAFLDEVATVVGKDPIQMRLELLEKVKSKPIGKITYEPNRFEEVIKSVAQRASWNKGKKGVYQGFSVYFSHNSYVAQIAEIEKIKRKVVLKKVYAVTDCGIVINQSGARNQVYGAIVDGLGHAMFGNLNFVNGEPVQKNYDTFRLIRYNEVPEIDAHFIDNGIDPTGLGEPALPPTGGALANAYYKATGKRLYKQPFVLEDQNFEEII